MKLIPLRCAFLTFALAVWLSGCGKKEARTPEAAPVVQVTEASVATAPLFGQTIAVLEGSTVTPIHAQVSGYLIKQAYTEGAEVKRGDLLFEMDPRPFQIALQQALAKSGEARDSAAKAARINLGSTKITAPVSGITGKAIAQMGGYVDPGMNLTTISTVDPIQASFTLTAQFYRDHAEELARIAERPMEQRPESFELVLADGTTYPRKGRFDQVERPITTTAGAMTADALFPNPDKVLRPGQYARVISLPETIPGAALIPGKCVTEWQGIAQVVVIKPDHTVEVRQVTTGEHFGSSWIITHGLRPGEKVVVEGIEMCQPGETVTPQPYVTKE